MLRVNISLAICLVILGCSGAQVLTPVPEDLPKADGQRHSLANSRASLQAPVPFRVVDATTWVLPLAPGSGILVHVQRVQEPAEGAMGHLDKMIADLQRQGEADVERDEKILLGDLDGRFVRALELRAKPAKGLWMVVTVAEDGMYTVTAAGPLTALRERQALLESFLLSLRVDPPEGTARPVHKQAIAEDIDLPQPTSPTQP